MRKNITLLGIIFAALATNGCDSLYWNEKATFDKIQNNKSLVVLTVNEPLVYSTNKTGEKFGIDHDLLSAFAHEYKLKPTFKTYASEKLALEALAKGEGDIVAARIRQESPYVNNQMFIPGPAYDETNLVLYCDKSANVAHVTDLNDKVIAGLKKDLSTENILRLRHFAPSARFNYLENSNTRQLMRDMNQGIYSCIITEALSGEFNARYFSKIEKIATLTGSFPLHWQFNENNKYLAQLSHIWFRKASRRDQITEIRNRYNALLSEVNSRDVRSFIKNYREIFPEFKNLFIQAGKEHSVPWQLAAAVAYQESHWNADAVSFTGVRGIMQLTEETAEHLGIDDRSDPEQSIWAGTKYLKMLLAKFPENLASKDRLALALAAYNIGGAHLEDAQILAAQKKLNPNSWTDLKKVLPLLEDIEIAKSLKYGKARGRETVEFVDRVKGFYSLIVLNSN